VSEERYFIDERGGCIAIRDKENTDPNDNGLHEETKGVVHYRMGQQKFENCPTCSHRRMIGWEVPQSVVNEIDDLCTELNRTNTTEDNRK